MALRMVALNRIADGRWFARKVIPKDVREHYARLYGFTREAHLKLPADTPRHEAKMRLGEWGAEIETRIPVHDSLIVPASKFKLAKEALVHNFRKQTGVVPRLEPEEDPWAF